MADDGVDGFIRWDAVPWRPATRQAQGAKTEGKLLKAIGARQHPRSGAGRIKDDGSDDGHVFEIKDARRSFTLKANDLSALFRRAARQGKEGTLLVFFSDIEATAIITLVPGGKELVK